MTHWSVAKRWPALLWLGLVLLALGYLAVRVQDGLPLRTDLMALLPREEQDPVRQFANEAVSLAAARRVVLLVGNDDRRKARAAATRIADKLAANGVAEGVELTFGGDRVGEISRLYFPYRYGLLSARDRSLLEQGRGDAIATRALAQLFGFTGLADGQTVKGDPFLLLPSFLAGLPLPLSRLVPDEGMLTVTEGGTNWVFVTARLAGNPMDLAVQDRFMQALDALVLDATTAVPGTMLRRLGVIFFAHEGSQRAINESSLLGSISIAGCLLLVLVVFRRWTPLLHTLLVMGIGLAAGVAGSLLIFGELHVAAMLFGTSLIGIAVDYSLHYSATVFHREALTPRARIGRVRIGITLGLLTTVIGYAALAAAPFPGLRQLAVFTIIGLVASYLTVLLWLPRLDRMEPARHGAAMVRGADLLPQWWERQGLWAVRVAVLIGLVGATIFGAATLKVEDDVRRMQRLSPSLLEEQREVRRLIGSGTEGQFLLIEAADNAAALRMQEGLEATLATLQAEGALRSYQMPASFVPSPQRQQDDRQLIRDRLEQPHLAAQLQRLGMIGQPAAGLEAASPLTLDLVSGMGAIPILRDLVLRAGLHVVMLDGVSAQDKVRAALVAMPGVRFIDATGDFSDLLKKYRERAVMLTAVSVLLMIPLLLWRYGARRTFFVLVPPLSAVIATPALLALGGESFTFFHAMALVIVLSIGIDYAIFCAESPPAHRSVTMVAVWLATLTTLLGFGLLAFSEVRAVSGFGLTMSVGMVLAFLLSPIAGPGRVK